MIGVLAVGGGVVGLVSPGRVFVGLVFGGGGGGALLGCGGGR